MNPLTSIERDRLLELLADEQLDLLSPEDRAELASLRIRAEDDPKMAQVMGELLLALDAADQRESLPQGLRDRLADSGRRVVAPPGRPVARSASRWWVGLAAGLVIATGALIVAWSQVQSRQRSLDEARAQVAVLNERIQSNEAVLASARTRVDELLAQAQRADAAATESELRLAQAAQRELELAERLAVATADLQDARLEIARYETPVDPAELQQNRRRLLDVPGTVRVAWSPFALPDAPAEQRDVQGDVVWNDELQQGYLRFVGLNVNDPNLEQYQVWVIDERGLEQKVSGGVFNATAQGEVIVPIEPGIDVGRVALFAITIENPGGTWVPDLKRRVVVAPRGEG